MFAFLCVVSRPRVSCLQGASQSFLTASWPSALSTLCKRPRGMGVMQGGQTAWRTCQAPEVILCPELSPGLGSEHTESEAGVGRALPSDREQEAPSTMTPALRKVPHSPRTTQSSEIPGDGERIKIFQTIAPNVAEARTGAACWASPNACSSPLHRQRKQVSLAGLARPRLPGHWTPKGQGHRVPQGPQRPSAPHPSRMRSGGGV